MQIAEQLARKKAGLVFHYLGDLDINSDVGRARAQKGGTSKTLTNSFKRLQTKA
ncbi:hypothetical protein VCRA2119O48_110072 [Vibrio crassostreae]|nr:hypothetical protein VCRA2119O48_110072 [Vibrio crassostreae]CAK3905386.1 hypothetical protein VCRA212O16_330012 [Vibrio crassostreae]